MKSKLTLIILFFGITSHAADTSCEGKWAGTYLDEARGWKTDSELIVSEDQTTWMSKLGMHKKKNSPCRDVVFPAKILQCTANEIEFIVDGSSVMSPRGNHCPDWQGKLKRTSEDTAEGYFLTDSAGMPIDEGSKPLSLKRMR
jgi:hypothetical protein